MSKLASYMAIGWGFLLVLLMLFTDFAMPKVNVHSDYLMTFHTAGTLAQHGRYSELYPAAGADTFSGSSFDNAAHEFLPELPKPSTAEYMYMPLVSALFIPFSLLPASISLFAFQIVSLIALSVSAFLISNAASKTDHFSGVGSTGGWISLTLLPLAISLWIGQVGLVFGLLPLCLGFHFLARKREFVGGLIWALAIFKPQFFIPALMVAGAYLLSGRWKILAGMVTGGALVGAANVAIFGPGMVSAWLECLKMAERVYSDLKYGVAQHIATSLPRALVLLVPVEQHHIWKPVIYGMAVILGLIGLFYMCKLLKTKQPEEIKLALCLLVAVFATPVMVPHVFLYDYCLLALAGFIAYAFSWSEAIGWRLKSLTWLTWAVVNLYTIILLINAKLALPIVLVLIMLEMYRRCLMAVRIAIKAGATD